MGFFGSKKKSADDASGAFAYGLQADDDDLPVATLVTEVPQGGASAPPPPPSTNPYSKPSAPPDPMMKKSQQPTVAAMNTIPSVFLTRNPTQMDACPCCQANARTRVVTAPSIVTWAVVVLLVFVFWPLCWLPLVMTKTKQSDHYCTSCNMKVGTIGACTDCCTQSKW